MTKQGGNYDPFSYGEVRLAPGTNERPRAADAPEDLLFASAQPSKRPQNDPGWEPVVANHDLLMGTAATKAPAGAPPQPQYGGDFGADILGEKHGSAAMPVVKARSTGQPLSAMQQEFGAKAQASGAMPSLGGMPEPARPQGPIVKEKLVGALPVQRLQVGPRHHAGSLALPVIVFVAGMAAGGWFWLVQHNGILGGFAAAIAVVGAAFTWIHFRR